MAKPLLKRILIANGADIPDGLDSDVLVVSPDELDEGTLDALQGLADAHAGGEGDETLEDELAEGEDVQALEEAAGEEQHGISEIQQMVEEKIAELTTMGADAAAIAESIPDAEDDAAAVSEHAEAAQEVAAKIADLGADDDPEDARKLSEEFMEHFDAASEACAKCQEYMPALGQGGDEPEEEVEEDADEDAGEPASTGLAGWAARTAGG